MTKDQDYEAAVENGYRLTLGTLLGCGVPYGLIDDARQAVWLRAWQYRDQCTSSNMVPWVLQIARNVGHDEIKRSSRVCSLGPEHDRPIWPLSDDKRIEVDLVLRKSAQCHQELLRAVFLNDEPRKKVAADLGISVPALNQRVSRALRETRSLMGNRRMS